MTATTTKYYRLRIYVGPVHVEEYVQQAKRSGLVDVWPGTEHVYATIASPPLLTETDRLCLRQTAAEKVYGTPMATGWRDVEILGTD